jgi:hypothetical protein
MQWFNLQANWTKKFVRCTLYSFIAIEILACLTKFIATWPSSPEAVWDGRFYKEELRWTWRSCSQCPAWPTGMPIPIWTWRWCSQCPAEWPVFGGVHLVIFWYRGLSVAIYQLLTGQVVYSWERVIRALHLSYVRQLLLHGVLPALDTWKTWSCLLPKQDMHHHKRMLKN